MNSLPAWSRRRVAQGIALAGVAGSWAWRNRASADSPRPVIGEITGATATDYDLTVARRPVAITGRARTGVLVNDVLPAPLLHWREGETITLRVHNALPETTSIHWHGLLVPPSQDGVPGLGFPGIAPGSTFTYRLPIQQHGTYWYHSHSGFQEQQGFYGAIVIEPREGASRDWDRDYVVMLSDWTDEDPHDLRLKLKKDPHYYNFNQRTVGDFLRDVEADGFAATLADRRAWRGMRMTPRDLADVSGYTYRYLVNGLPPEANWTALYAPGERVRLRFINASAMTYFDVRIPGLPMTVVAADGQPVVPVTVDEFRLGNAETYDVIVTPSRGQAFTLYAQSMDRTGFARGTLAPAPGMSAPVPPPDPRAELTLADMGHGAGGHGAHGGVHGHDVADPAAATPSGHEGHEGHVMPAAPTAGADRTPVPDDPVRDNPAVPGASAVLPRGPSHGPDEYGPGVDMRVTVPSTRLDDPGVGLRDNGRRVLTYADLRSAFPDPDGRAPGRTLELHLTGHMGRYIWSFNGRKFSAAEPLRLVYGERLRIVLLNDTMMEHPIHLHGLWSDLEDERGEFLVRKHTISVKPAQQLSFRVRADALGRWALHCHLLLHMESGMMREVIVE